MNVVCWACIRGGVETRDFFKRGVEGDAGLEGCWKFAFQDTPVANFGTVKLGILKVLCLVSGLTVKDLFLFGINIDESELGFALKFVVELTDFVNRAFDIILSSLT